YVSAPPALTGEDAAHARSLTIRGVIEGDSVPQVFIPRLLELYRRGEFPFDRLIGFYSLEEINRAVADARSGATVKPVLVMQGNMEG
ncbi:MAG TPA: NAD(P)-dependent alcohol dehydrogenase, partial [Negativicutes bacterium]|nr:NAD(P)-dependent alcohol dehydrogenase [Negativicutes bacterium]